MFWVNAGFPRLYLLRASFKTIIGAPASSRIVETRAFSPEERANAADLEVCLIREALLPGSVSSKMRSVTACCRTRRTTSSGRETCCAISAYDAEPVRGTADQKSK